MNRIKEWLQLFVAFFKVGLLTIGGGYAMLPILEREVAIDKKWLTTDEILEYYSVAQSLPGVIASNTAVFIGYRLGGVMGAVSSVIGVITPSIIIIIFVTMLFQQIETMAVVQQAFTGVRIMVLALLIHSMLRMIKSSIFDFVTLSVGLMSFVYVMFFHGSPIIMIIIAGMIGCGFYRKRGNL